MELEDFATIARLSKSLIIKIARRFALIFELPKVEPVACHDFMNV
jgi:hypothetical protein